MQQRKITFIGAGNMAHAIIAGLISAGYPANNITVCSPTSKNREQLDKCNERVPPTKSGA